jgi:hypothetical protein
MENDENENSVTRELTAGQVKAQWPNQRATPEAAKADDDQNATEQGPPTDADD